jgi:hypothetical protein
VQKAENRCRHWTIKALKYLNTDEEQKSRKEEGGTRERETWREDPGPSIPAQTNSYLKTVKGKAKYQKVQSDDERLK